MAQWVVVVEQEALFFESLIDFSSLVGGEVHCLNQSPVGGRDNKVRLDTFQVEKRKTEYKNNTLATNLRYTWNCEELSIFCDTVLSVVVHKIREGRKRALCSKQFISDVRSSLCVNPKVFDDVTVFHGQGVLPYTILTLSHKIAISGNSFETQLSILPRDPSMVPTTKDRCL